MSVLTDLGFRKRDAQVYETLLASGPLSVRRLAAVTGLNRGSVYDTLKALRERGLVSYYHQRSRQYFTAEDPIRVSQLIEERAGALERARQSYDRLLPNLRAQYERAGGKPTASFYEGDQGVHDILDDLLAVVRMRRPREYVAYSSASIRPHLYRAYPGFSAKRIASRIHVRVVSFGSGGRLVGLDERRWLPKRVPAPTYTLIYADRVAHISVDDRGACRGTVVTDAAIAQSQRLLFDVLWTTLPSRER